MRNPIHIIALDLDGTLLNSNKELSSGNLAALERAASAGIEIVPTTGRFYNGMPEIIRKLPFIRYAITINGAQVADLQTGEVIYRAEIPWEQAVEVMTFLDELSVIYDCFQDNAGWMTGALKKRIDSEVADPHYRKMLHELRQSVPDLKEVLRERKRGVQKVQFFTDRPELRLQMLKELPQRFADVVVSSSTPENVEINNIRANKGQALRALAKHMGVDEKATIAFGDGLNDLSMLRDAGVGVAMANAGDQVKTEADWITLSCDQDGVAYGIKKFCFGEE